MTNEEIRAILTICLLASYADGEKHDREREQIRQVAEGLAGNQQINLPGLYQDVLLRRVQLPQALEQLSTEESRQLAYEMAVCICEADGQTSAKELAFLNQLSQQLGVGSNNPSALDRTPEAGFAPAGNFAAQAQAVAQAPLQTALPDVSLPQTEALPHPSSLDHLGTAAQRQPGKFSPSEMDSKILKAAILNGAIELLPENLSTLAIIPLQMRLVYQVGQSYGYELDTGHIKDLLATLGVGLTSQYLEQAGRKLLGGLLGKAGKGFLAGLGRQAVSSGMSFAATYALGHVANQYYAGGRTLSTDMLKDAYQHVMQEGRQLQTQYLPQIQETARGLNSAKILSMVRGG